MTTIHYSQNDGLNFVLLRIFELFVSMILLENPLEAFAFEKGESRVVAGRFASIATTVLAGARRRTGLTALIMMDYTRRAQPSRTI